MVKPTRRAYLRGTMLLLTTNIFFSVFAQISQSVPAVQFGLFSIASAVKVVKGQSVLSIRIFKGSQLMLSDSVVTDDAGCKGFAFPSSQPFKDYFIFSKHAPHSGRTYILNRQGDFAVIGGGTFWAAPKDKLLFILAEKDYRNLVVYSLKEMKTIFEKYSCDEFTDWYYRKGGYFGKVSTECGDEIKQEKEVNEWIHPVETEQFNVKLRTLEEMHITDEQVEKSKPLVKYASCK